MIGRQIRVFNSKVFMPIDADNEEQRATEAEQRAVNGLCESLSKIDGFCESDIITIISGSAPRSSITANVRGIKGWAKAHVWLSPENFDALSHWR